MKADEEDIAEWRLCTKRWDELEEAGGVGASGEL